eukprot:2717541-Prymnesium_polylepis.1
MCGARERGEKKHSQAGRACRAALRAVCLLRGRGGRARAARPAGDALACEVGGASLVCARWEATP